MPPYIRKTKSLEAALVVPEWHLQRRDGRCLEGAGGSGRGRSVGQYGIAPEAGLGAGVPGLVRRSFGSEPLGSMSGLTASTVMGFWAALEEVYPETRQQRYWMHKTINVLNCLPKSAQPKAKQALHEIWQAQTQADLAILGTAIRVRGQQLCQFRLYSLVDQTLRARYQQIGNWSLPASRPASLTTVFLLMVAYLIRLVHCVATTNQPDTPLLFNYSNTRFGYNSGENGDDLNETA